MNKTGLTYTPQAYQDACDWAEENAPLGVKWIILNALKKQIPKKPNIAKFPYRCSVCGTRVRSGNGSSSQTKDTVCRKCFQVIDWNYEKANCIGYTGGKE